MAYTISSISPLYGVPNFTSKSLRDAAIMKQRRICMYEYPLTKDVSYRVNQPVEFTAQTAQAYMRASSLIFDGQAFKPTALLQALNDSQRLDFAGAVLELSIRQSLLLGLLPYRVLLDPLGSLERAAKSGVMIVGDNINVACFSAALEQAQELALTIAPQRFRDIFTLYQHPLIAGHMALKIAPRTARPSAIRTLAEGEYPLTFPACYQEWLDPLIEGNDPVIAHIHACCFSDVSKAMETGAHFEPMAIGLLGGAVSSMEDLALQAGYSWRGTGVFPLLPRAAQPEFLVNLVSHLPSIQRGMKQLKVALATEPKAFSMALAGLDPIQCQKLISIGVLNHNHLEIVNEVGRSMLLELDLGL
ncbi:hypothetical protein RBE51_21800 [Pseudomonas taiwanensis]|uniref:hypothetical protein n=1 Tax=Pseudomonas taiwanensis TaxID=470150 RepID=UPI0028DFD672|nr:hypothetical protein [Pseudomonas taiwanensis]MDT8925434.1 hypothetical protein [Pseudomonas taiwanensis]